MLKEQDQQKIHNMKSEECKHVIVPHFKRGFYFCLKCNKMYEVKEMIKRRKRLPKGWREIKKNDS